MDFRGMITRITGLLPRPVSDEERQRNAGLTLAQILDENAGEHAAGCHGRLCRGGCVERTRRRWTAAGWR